MNVVRRNVIEDHIAILIKVATQFRSEQEKSNGTPTLDSEAFGVAVEAAMHAAPYFNPEVGKFGSFVAHCAKRALVKWVVREKWIRIREKSAPVKEVYKEIPEGISYKEILNLVPKDLRQIPPQLPSVNNKPHPAQEEMTTNRRRNVLILRIWGLKWREIAVICHMSKEGVQQNYGTTLDRLRQRLKEQPRVKRKKK